MKVFRKILSLCCAAAISFAALTPAMTAVKADAAAVAWYPKGDFDLSGKLQTTDARSILRIAAYLDPQPAKTSIKFDAADFDGDGVLTSHDARIAHRVASKLDTAPTVNAKAAALKRIQDVNFLKAAPDENHTKSYELTLNEVSYGAIEVATGISFTGAMMSSLKSDIEKRNTITNKIKPSYYLDRQYYVNPTYNSTYYYNLPVYEDKAVVFPTNATTAIIKSTSFTGSADGSYTLRINFVDFTIRKNKAETANQKMLEKIIPGIHDRAQLTTMGTELLGSMGDDDTIEITIHDSTKFKTSLFGSENTYYFQNAVTGAYLEYKFNAAGIPVSAVYYSKQAIQIPATIKMGISEATFAMTSFEEITNNYVFTYAEK